MRRLFIILFGSATVLALGAADKTLNSERDKASYGIGMSIGRTLKQQGMDIDLQIMNQAIQDVLQEKEPKLTEEEARGAVTSYQRESVKRMSEANKKAGEAFLEENKKKEGIHTTASGLQYQVVTEGTGPKPTLADQVSVNYRGTLIDGTEFDNSYKRSGPEKLALTNVIQGWSEALQMMPVGSKWKIFIPAPLAYGERGRPRIPPHSVLLFDMELVGIEPPAAEAPAPAPSRE